MEKGMLSSRLEGFGRLIQNLQQLGNQTVFSASTFPSQLCHPLAKLLTNPGELIVGTDGRYRMRKQPQKEGENIMAIELRPLIRKSSPLQRHHNFPFPPYILQNTHPSSLTASTIIQNTPKLRPESLPNPTPTAAPTTPTPFPCFQKSPVPPRSSARVYQGGEKLLGGKLGLKTGVRWY